jgi:hypothetical protein
MQFLGDLAALSKTFVTLARRDNLGSLINPYLLLRPAHYDTKYQVLYDTPSVACSSGSCYDQGSGFSDAEEYLAET